MAEFLAEKEKRILEVEARKKIYAVVKSSPGSHFREIERKSSLPTGTVKYHLSYLARYGLVKEQKGAHTVRYFPLSFDSKNITLLSFLRQKSIRNILLFILTHEHCNHEHIVSFTKLSPSTVSWHLKKLEEHSIITAQRKGRKAFYSILIDKKEIMALLITYQESFLDALVDNVVEMWG
jgi:predicted transcriptional regulator